MRCCRGTVCALRGTGPGICNAQAERGPVRHSLATDWCVSASFFPRRLISQHDGPRRMGHCRARRSSKVSVATPDPWCQREAHALRAWPAAYGFAATESEGQEAISSDFTASGSPLHSFPFSRLEREPVDAIVALNHFDFVPQTLELTFEPLVGDRLLHALSSRP